MTWIRRSSVIHVIHSTTLIKQCCISLQFSHAVRLFTDAYGRDVLSSLDLSRSAFLKSSESLGETHRRVNEEQRQALYDIIQMSSLSQLDLSYCTACKTQEWISMLGQCR